MQREMSMRENGLMIRLMALGFILISMAVGMRGSGTKISNMDMELSSGLMEPSMRGSMNKA